MSNKNRTNLARERMQGMGREGKGRGHWRTSREGEKGWKGKRIPRTADWERRRRREMERNDEYCRLAGQRHIRQKTRELQSG